MCNWAGLNIDTQYDPSKNDYGSSNAKLRLNKSQKIELNDNLTKSLWCTWKKKDYVGVNKSCGVNKVTNVKQCESILHLEPTETIAALSVQTTPYR